MLPTDRTQIKHNPHHKRTKIRNHHYQQKCQNVILFHKQKDFSHQSNYTCTENDKGVPVVTYCISFYILPGRLWEFIAMVVGARQTWWGRRGEWWGCQRTSAVPLVTTMCFPAKLVLPGATAKEGQRGSVSQGFITTSHKLSPQWFVVAFLQPNSQSARKIKGVFIQMNGKASSHRGEKSQPTTVKKKSETKLQKKCFYEAEMKLKQHFFELLFWFWYLLQYQCSKYVENHGINLNILKNHLDYFGQEQWCKTALASIKFH